MLRAFVVNFCEQKKAKKDESDYEDDVSDVSSVLTADLESLNSGDEQLLHEHEHGGETGAADLAISNDIDEHVEEGEGLATEQVEQTVQGDREWDSNKFRLKRKMTAMTDRIVSASCSVESHSRVHSS